MEHAPYERHEDEAHRLDRNLGELLQELRVVGSGVQILFGFLLAMAFQTRFHTLGIPQKVVYVVTLLLSVLTSGLLISPVAIHRLMFREGAKDEVVDVTARLARLGMASLALAMTGSVLLVVDQAGGWVLAIPVAALVVAVLGGLWWAIPARLRSLGRQ